MLNDTCPRVLVLDATPDLPGGAEALLEPGFAPVSCVGVEDLTYRLHRERVDAVVVDARHDALDVPEILAAVRAKARSGADLPVLVVVPEALGEAQSSALLAAGAHDLVAVELVDPMLVHRLRRLLRTRALQGLQAEWEAGQRRQREAFEGVVAEQASLSCEGGDGWNVRARSVPCGAYAGDFVLAFEPRPGRLVLAVGDVLGEGATALARAATVRGAVAASALVADTPGEALALANRTVGCLLGPDAYARVWLAVLDGASGRLALSHAGLPGFAWQPSGAGARAGMAAGGPALGVDTEASYDQGEVELAPGSRLLVGTPGTLVAHRGEEIETSLARLAHVLESVAGEPADPAWTMIWGQLAALHQPATDDHDMTLLLVERTRH